MSKNVNWVGIKNLEKIIRKLGIKAKELECVGVSNISQLLTGAKAITEKVSAPALVEKIKQISHEKGIDIGFEVNVDLLLGRINIITSDILKDLEKEVITNTISEDTVNSINNNLKELSNDDAISFLNDTIQVFNNNIYLNAEFIEKYAKKLLRLKLNFNQKMKAYQELIRAYRGLRKYNEIIYTAETIEEDLQICKDKDIKISCYYNIAFAYYKEKRFEECMPYYKKLKNFGEVDEFFYFTLESNRFASKKEFDKAEKGYMNVLKKAKAQYNNDYIVDSCANLAALYDEMKLNDKAKKSLEDAVNSINCSTSKLSKCNTYYIAFKIYVKCYPDEFNMIEEFFNKALMSVIDVNDLGKLNIIVEIMFNKYFEINAYDKVIETSNKIKGLKINSEILFRVIDFIQNYK